MKALWTEDEAVVPRRAHRLRQGVDAARSPCPPAPAGAARRVPGPADDRGDRRVGRRLVPGAVLGASPADVHPPAPGRRADAGRDPASWRSSSTACWPIRPQVDPWHACRRRTPCSSPCRSEPLDDAPRRCSTPRRHSSTASQNPTPTAARSTMTRHANDLAFDVMDQTKTKDWAFLARLRAECPVSRPYERHGVHRALRRHEQGLPRREDLLVGRRHAGAGRRPCPTRRASSASSTRPLHPRIRRLLLRGFTPGAANRCRGVDARQRAPAPRAPLTADGGGDLMAGAGDPAARLGRRPRARHPRRAARPGHDTGATSCSTARGRRTARPSAARASPARSRSSPPSSTTQIAAAPRAHGRTARTTCSR